MLKPSLQLKLGQQLTMTPQLQQAIRLLQLPALELQAHIRELLETNVMLEPVDDGHEEGLDTSTLEHPAAPEPVETAESPHESSVEVLDEGWGEHSVGPAEAAWSGDEDDRQQEFADSAGQSLQEYLLWQLELAKLEPRELAIARAIVDAISDDGYLTEPLEEIANTLRPEIHCEPAEVEATLGGVQALDPPGVGARSVGECIELQLRQLDPAIPGINAAIEIARHHLERIAGRELAVVKRELRASDEDLAC
ncbi:MAG TPA: RNA polymerase factor sigma-54, partial [Steroidobacteraceae bacterium]|nr:RNA polymerase factor sigma-54 [Steroidobacteraceae bacterium]